MSSLPITTTATYSGIGFPPRKGAGYGFFYIETDSELISGNITVILNTKKGTMLMNPEFGSSAQDLLFEPINELTQSLIADLIKADIERWEPRVSVIAMKAASFENTRVFELSLQIKATGIKMSYIATF